MSHKTVWTCDECGREEDVAAGRGMWSNSPPAGWVTVYKERDRKLREGHIHDDTGKAFYPEEEDEYDERSQHFCCDECAGKNLLK